MCKGVEITELYVKSGDFPQMRIFSATFCFLGILKILKLEF